MKRKFISSKACLVVLFLLTVFASCKKEEETPYIDKGATYFTGDGSFTQMTPTPTTPSTGTAVLSARFDNNSKVFNYMLQWKDLSGLMTQANFYFPSDAVQNGVLVRNIVTAQARPTTDSIAGQIWGNNTLSDQELNDLKAGKVYYTISTQLNTGGEVRGQIKVKQ